MFLYSGLAATNIFMNPCLTEHIKRWLQAREKTAEAFPYYPQALLYVDGYLFGLNQASSFMKCSKSKAIVAAINMDWQQVVLNGGPPCFHLEGDRFCLRAECWFGHLKTRGSAEDHEFVSLEDMLSSL